MNSINTLKAAKEITGWIPVGSNTKLSDPDFSLPAIRSCNVGEKLATIKNSSCHDCFATTGNYGFPSVQKALNGRQDLIETHTANDTMEEWITAMVFVISKKVKNNRFRWFSSGDIFNNALLLAIVEIAKRFPEIDFWLPTKEFNRVLWFLREYGGFPPNLHVRISAPMINGFHAIEKWSKIKIREKHLSDYVTFSIVSENDPSGFVCPSITDKVQCGVGCNACFHSNEQIVNYPVHTRGKAFDGIRKKYFASLKEKQLGAIK